MRQPKPYYRKQKQCWCVQIGGRQLSLGREKKAAWKRYHELMANQERIRPTATVETLFERYLDWVEENRAPGTYKKIRDNLSSFAAFIGKNRQVGTLHGADLSEWVESRPTWASTTRNEAIGNVVRCFNWAVGKRYLSNNNVAVVPDRPRRVARETILEEGDWERILGFVKDQQFRDLLTFMWETGCRPIEVRKMEAKHVNLDSSILVFPASEAKGERHERIIYLTDVAAEICRRLIEKHPTGPLMRNTRGRAWTKDAINCRFTRLKKKLGKRVFAYAFRHTYATQGLMDDVDSVTLSQLLGHSDVSTLAKNYAHLSKKQSYLLAQAKQVRKRV